MKIISDLQLHSKYARAVSKDMVIPKIWEWAKIKGINLIATGDWTHPLWLREIKSHTEETGSGLLKLKNTGNGQGSTGPQFLLETEVSCIYSQGGKLRRIHILIWVPTISSAEKINKKLMSMGANLMSDGRPIMGLTSKQIADTALSIDPKSLIIPAHIWTPWFSLFGSQSGFDSIEECFGDYARYIYGVETGLSSNPLMNWRIKELDSRSIVSFSDAHSGPKLGREATVFEVSELTFDNIRRAIMEPFQKAQGSSKKSELSKNRIDYTIEFYPEEGKYHYTGHRNCNIKQTPEETKNKGTICPVCGRKLTVGVMHRVEQLSGRKEEILKINFKEIEGIRPKIYFSESFKERPPYMMLVPLHEILAQAIGGLPTSKNIQNEYKKLTDFFNCEFNVTLSADTKDIARISGEKTAEAIYKVRQGDIYVDPGYDGVFGKVKIWHEKKTQEKSDKKDQMSLF
ncbi:hypothetical protein A2777_04200 [Candidatus Gottesmanbacteria bacterium RIFCSPHIGHO2_01_FULL_40_15]|uniref:DNA helicase UvrD n=1 Tax=Candidatus Gottesmanbacteria bacterium RIFCSPHIGHO2_01_FULL_40_15 TaxID=1798376 RepID=A0A1F5Z4K8_9BACT|nr:MAG: hypothetical protein A2777_04200 [Candidatus Gottesmanbacteria bacterium RIFCSPHIGHO2_01_FULL_40_15]